LTLAGYAPEALGGDKVIIPGVGAVGLAGQGPTIGTVATPGVGSLSLAGTNARVRPITVHAEHGGVPRVGTQGTNADRVTSARTNADRDTEISRNADRDSKGKTSGWRKTSNPKNRYRGN
jgi:hypothetical protein